MLEKQGNQDGMISWGQCAWHSAAADEKKKEDVWCHGSCISSSGSPAPEQTPNQGKILLKDLIKIETFLIILILVLECKRCSIEVLESQFFGKEW